MWCGWLILGTLQLSQTATVGTATVAAALDEERHDDSPLLGLVLHGFVSQGAFKSTANNYLGSSKRGSFAFTEVGLNVTRSLTDQLSAGVQFFARFLGSIGGFSAKFDWFYLDYHWTDWLGIRAGRVKLPFGLYNESSDVDSARVPILLPQGVYPIQNRDYLLAQTGAELYGFVPIGPVGALSYRLYGGTILFDDLFNRPNPGPLQLRKLETPYLFGGQLIWETPLSGLRLGGSVQDLKLQLDADVDASLSDPLKASGQLPEDFAGSVTASIPALLWIASAEYVGEDILLAAEYSRWNLDVESSQPVLIPESHTLREQFYVMVSYQVTDWLHPGAYYSVFFPDVKKRSFPEGSQQDVAVTLRFDVNSYWLIKLEGHYLHGTAALTSSENDNRPLDALTPNWGLFLVKTTLQF